MSISGALQQAGQQSSFAQQSLLQTHRGYGKQPAAQDTPHDHEHVHIENEIEKELQRAGDRGGIRALLQVIESHGEDFDEMNVATAFHELAKVGKGKSDKELEEMHVHDTFQSLVDMVILGRRRFNARLLTNIIQSAAELKFDDEALMDKISQNLITRIDKLDAIEVSDLATGLAALEHSPSVILFEALQKRAGDLEGELDDKQIKAMKEAFKSLGYKEYAEKL